MLLFAHEILCHKKGVVWVLRDEILRCAQNDRGEAWVRMFYSPCL
jgi:hypothetical protein